MSVIVSCSHRWASLSPNQYLLGDIYGKLLLLTLQHKAGRDIDLTIRDLGDVSSRRCLLSASSAFARTRSRSCPEIRLKLRHPPRAQATSPTSIVALRDSSSHATADAPTDLVYLSSRFGDSQLVRLEGLTSGSGSVELELVASYSSLAPITDCCLIQDEAGGAVRSRLSHARCIVIRY